MTGHVVISTPLEQQLRPLVRKVRTAFGVDGVIVRVLKGSELLVVASAGVPARNLYPSLSVKWGISAEIIRRRRPILIKRVQEHPATAPYVKKLPRGYQFVSYAGVPLLVEEKVVGIMGLYATKRSLAFTEVDLEHLQIVANHIAVTIVNADLYKAVAEHRNQLSMSNAELEKRVAERTARLRETIESLEGVCYHVAHDLRAPLRAMQGFSEALIEDYGHVIDQTGAEYVQRVIGASQRMDLFISDLLEYGRLTHVEIALEETDMAAEINKVLSFLTDQIVQSKAMVCVEGPFPAVKAHPSILGQVLMNLVSNAIKFVARGATPQIRIWAEHCGKMVRLWVEDNGIGIEAAHQQRVFQIFERLHSGDTYSGTGIGLAIVRKGIERMGGQVGVESALGKGSRFWVMLPNAGAPTTGRQV